MSTLPFTAVIGHDDVRLALIVAGIDPAVGGVLLTGEKGTAKTTLVRAFAELLPEIMVVKGCRFSCDPTAPDLSCPDGPHGEAPASELRPTRLVELPLGATDDRITGSMDVAKVLSGSSVADSFTPGLLAAAHRGVLFVDEVNLLPDALVDLLLDAAATGRVNVEREGISLRHAARFVLVGTMNPEEGELRPQLLDRFGLCVPVVASRDPEQRTKAVRARLAFDSNPAAVMRQHAQGTKQLGLQIVNAQVELPHVRLSDEQLLRVSRACMSLDVDGLRGDVVTARTAMALAAWREHREVGADDVRDAAMLALPHRRRRGPFDAPGMDHEELDNALDPDDGPDHEPPDDDDPGSGQAQPVGESARADTPSTEASGEAKVGSRASGSSSTMELPEVPFAVTNLAARRRRELGASGRRSRGPTQRGRSGVSAMTTGSRAELLPTIRASAPYQRSRGADGSLIVRESDLRRSIREGRQSALVILVLDTSGSMAARRRTQSVSTAALSLLQDSYCRRDRVAVISFRQDSAVTIVAPTGSHDAAARRLRNLPVGGRTPLAEGLLAAQELSLREHRRDPARQHLVVVITDGRSTSGADARGRARQMARVIAKGTMDAIVIDAEDGHLRLGLAQELADELGARCIPLPELAASDAHSRDRAARTLREIVREGKVA